MILADEQSEPGGSLLDGCAASIDGEMADAWLAWSLAELAGNPRVRVMPRTTAFGYFPHNNLGLVERLTDHLASPADGQRARAPVAGARARGRARDRRHRAAARVPGQRPAGRDAGRRRAQLSRPLRRARRHARRGRDDDGRRLPHGARAREGRHRDRGDRGPARESARRRGASRARCGHRGHRGRERARHARRAARLPHRHRRAPPRLRPRADVGRPRARGAPVLAVPRPAHLERRGAGLRAVRSRPSARTRRARAAACSGFPPRWRTARPRASPRRAQAGTRRRRCGSR